MSALPFVLSGLSILFTTGTIILSNATRYYHRQTQRSIAGLPWEPKTRSVRFAERWLGVGR